MSSDYDLAMRLHREENARSARVRSKRKRYNPSAEAAKPQLGRKQAKAKPKARPKPEKRSKAAQAKRRRTVTTPSYVMQPFHIRDGKKERTVWYAGTVTKIKGRQAELIVVRWMDGDVTDVDQWAAKLRNKYLVPLTRKRWADMSAAYEVDGTFKAVTKQEMAHWLVK